MPSDRLHEILWPARAGAVQICSLEVLAVGFVLLGRRSRLSKTSQSVQIRPFKDAGSRNIPSMAVGTQGP